MFFCILYLDDILIYSSSTSQHFQYIELVLSQLRSISLFAKPAKREFSLTVLEFLQHFI